MLDLLLTPLSAMRISPVRNSMNSSKAASSPSDLDAWKVSWVSASGKSCSLEQGVVTSIHAVVSAATRVTMRSQVFEGHFGSRVTAFSALGHRYYRHVTCL